MTIQENFEQMMAASHGPDWLEKLSPNHIKEKRLAFFGGFKIAYSEFVQLGGLPPGQAKSHVMAREKELDEFLETAFGN